MSALLLAVLTAAYSPGDFAVGPSGETAVQALATKYLKDYPSLNVPELVTRDYRDYFKAIPTAKTIESQRQKFAIFARSLAKIDKRSLGLESASVYEQLRFEFEINLERLALESRFIAQMASQPAPEGGLYHLPDHERWYRFFLHLVASKDFSPEQLIALGEKEVKRIHSEMRKIQKALGFEGRDQEFYAHLNDSSFFIFNEKQVSDLYSAIDKKTRDGLGKVFARADVPVVKVAPVPDANENTPPGRYDDGTMTFFFNFWGGKHNRRTAEMFFIHEAIPGHHYQTVIANQLKLPLAKLWYQAFSEGWAAYCENLGLQMGLYADLYARYGKWEWDLVRSTRLKIDVGIHYLGWSRAEALGYWKKSVPNQDQIAIREIDRITRWPAQVASYKIGEDEILRLRNAVQLKQGKSFDIRAFHANILSRGSVPLFVLAERILKH